MVMNPSILQNGSHLAIQLNFDAELYLNTPFKLTAKRSVRTPATGGWSIPDCKCYCYCYNAEGTLIPDHTGNNDGVPALVGTWTGSGDMTFNGTLLAGTPVVYIQLEYDYTNVDMYTRFFEHHELTLEIDASKGTITNSEPRTYVFDLKHQELPIHYLRIGQIPSANVTHGTGKALKFFRVDLANVMFGLPQAAVNVPFAYYATLIGYSPAWNKVNDNYVALGAAGAATSENVEHLNNNPIVNSKGGVFKMGSIRDNGDGTTTLVEFEKSVQTFRGVQQTFYIIPANTLGFFMAIEFDEGLTTVSDSYEWLSMYCFRSRLLPPFGKSSYRIRRMTHFRAGYRTNL